MKKYIPIEKLFYKKEQHGLLYKLYDKFDFMRIFILWMIIIMIFAVLYILISHNHPSLIYSSNPEQPISYVDFIYFSFITATSTGFGDIVPVGFSKILSLIEVVLGLTIFAMVTSKLVSIKQEAILNEIYDISINERINRIRSSLYAFRIDVSKLIMKAEEGMIKKREINDVWTRFSSVENVVTEIRGMFSKKDGDIFSRNLDEVNTKILMNSINLSLKRIIRLFEVFETSNHEWKSDLILSLTQRIIEETEKLYEVVLDKKHFIGNKEIEDIRKSFLEAKTDLSKYFEKKEETNN